MSLDGWLMAVPIRLHSPNVEAGAAVQPLLTHLAVTPAEVIDGPQYIVSLDGQRFLVNTVSQEANAPPISFILNWKPPAK